MLFKGKNVLTITKFIYDVIHDLTYQMNAKSTYRTLFGRERRIDLALVGRVKRLSTITDNEINMAVAGNNININQAFRSLRVGVTHHIDDGLL